MSNKHKLDDKIADTDMPDGWYYDAKGILRDEWHQDLNAIVRESETWWSQLIGSLYGLAFMVGAVVFVGYVVWVLL